MELDYGVGLWSWTMDLVPDLPSEERERWV
jgi:hypothetical protein